MTTNTTKKTTSSLEQFYTELLQDPMLQERLKAATDPESLSELAVQLGKEKGFFFTKEEVLAAMAVEAAMEGEYEEVPLTDGRTGIKASF
ncbi:Nif11-like leader peptide family natural product precursor [Scytonema millei]|uniref:Nif11-like leader peptide family natural product n=1 Tax=Scytonema millei VB511283 TaxID=1245923 RepID=A0A9X5E6R8_9CYAN|nr:Nif11-like leader peptide family natural product precursor [Scytonema millei]NHC35963.1 Nif11-like leader peptide family natural product precursor [Scytonema millei VB511283]